MAYSIVVSNLTKYFPLSQHSFLSAGKPHSQVFTALDDLSFAVEEGCILGIIGPNGAGKSTLLKVLAGITKPSRGRVLLRGTVNSLLEIGIGFHQDLSGRENIFLNGALLGMHKKEISALCDEIIYFSGVEQFIDIPVKHYSTGMYARLAFSVASYLRSDILLIDEVLSVGDAEFQKQSLQKIEEIITQGRTVIFVSHNLEFIQRYCHNGLFLLKGKSQVYGSALDAVQAYHAYIYATQKPIKEEVTVQPALTDHKAASLVSWWANTQGSHYAVTGKPCTFSFCFNFRTALKKTNSAFSLFDADHRLLWTTSTLENGSDFLAFSHGVNTFHFSVPFLPFYQGLYQLYISINAIDEGISDSWYVSPYLTIVPEKIGEAILSPKWQGVFVFPALFKCDSGTNLT